MIQLVKEIGNNYVCNDKRVTEQCQYFHLIFFIKYVNFYKIYFQDFRWCEAVFIHHSPLTWIFWMICQHLAESHSLCQTVSSVFWSYLGAHSLYSCLTAARSFKGAGFPSPTTPLSHSTHGCPSFCAITERLCGTQRVPEWKTRPVRCRNMCRLKSSSVTPRPLFCWRFGQGHVCSSRWMPSLYF